MRRPDEHTERQDQAGRMAPDDGYMARAGTWPPAWRPIGAAPDRRSAIRSAMGMATTAADTTHVSSFGLLAPYRPLCWSVLD